MADRVVITGGTGLIGGAVASRFAGDGWDVVVLTRDPEGRRDAVPAGVRLVPWDASSGSGWADEADGAAAVINLAGASLAEKRWTPEQKQRITASRLGAGRAVLEACEQATAPPRVVVQSSAVGYYGPRGDEEVTEGTPPGDDFLARLCVEWEATTAGVERLGTRQVVARTGVVLSTEGGALPRMLPPFRLGAGGRLGSGRQWISWIHLEDAARALHWLATGGEAQGAYNVTAPEPARNATFTRALGAALGRPTVVAVPAWGLKLAFGEMAVTLLEGQRVIPSRLRDDGFTYRHPALDGALADLLG